MPNHYATSWMPREDLVISLSDETAAERTQEERDQMFLELREVVKRHGFDLNAWGSDASFRKYYQAPLKKECEGFFDVWDSYWLANTLGGPTFDQLSEAAERIRKFII